MGQDTPTTTAPEIRSGSTRQKKHQKQQKKQTQKEKTLPDPSYKQSITPTAKLVDDDIPPDHPIHKVPLEKQEKWRAKGINPVLRAEMDELNRGRRGFWARLGPWFQNMNVMM